MAKYFANALEGNAQSWIDHCNSILYAGLSLRAGGRGFSPATTSLSPGYFDTKRKYSKEKNASNYKVMNLKKNKPIVY